MNFLFEESDFGKRQVRREVLWFIVIFLVSTVSFAVGYLAGREFNRSPIIIEKVAEPPSI